MKLKKRLKKGFTLVELIVVIAIVAILAAVSVVSYIAFINSANESADIQLVKQLNTCLQADEALHGKKDWSIDYKGLTNLLESNGFIIENLTKTKSGLDMVYQGADKEGNIINRYALLNTDKVIYSETTFADASNFRNLWIPETFDEAKTLSKAGKGVVLGSELGELTEEFEAHGSVIVNGAKVSSIKYKNSTGNTKNVVMRTEGGKLTVDAPTDTVSHYEDVVDVNIVSVSKNASYHEFGRVAGSVELTSGRFVVENGGEATTLVINNDDANEVTVIVEEEASVGALIDLNNIIDDETTAQFNYKVTNADTENTVEEIITAEAYIEEAGSKVYYQSLQEAINNGNGNTVVVLRDLEYEVNAGEYALKVGNSDEDVVLTLDLNGKLITGYLYNTESCQVIRVGGDVEMQGKPDRTAKLTIIDQTAPEHGYSTGAIYGLPSMSSDSWSVAVSTISVNRNGELVVESGKIINGYEGFEVTSDANPYAIDVLTNTGAQPAKLTVNGGLIESKAVSGVGIRAFCNSAVGICYITINGGHVFGDSRAVMLQYPSNNKKCLLECVINNGRLESATRALDVLNFNSAAIADSQFNITVNGGEYISHNDTGRVKFPGSDILYVSYTTNVTAHINFTDNR